MTLNTNPEILAQLTFNLNWWSDGDIRDSMRLEYLLEEFVFDDENVQYIYLQHKADMISDYWNKYHETTQYEYNPIFNVEAEETETRTITGTKTNTRTLDLTDTRTLDLNDTRTPDLSTVNEGVRETITNGTETTTHFDSPVRSEDFESTEKTTLEHQPSVTEREGAVKMTGTETTARTGTDTTANSGSDTNVESYQNYRDELHRVRGGNIGVTMTQQMIQAERNIIPKLKEMYLAEFADYFMITM